MPDLQANAVELDYGPAATPELLANLSGVAADGKMLWTCSDEGRTVECLRRRGGGYRLERQYIVDDLVKGIPGQRDDDEIDLESLDIAGGTLWLCGSHARVRRELDPRGRLDPSIRSRPSRRVLAAITLKSGVPGRARLAPTDGNGSLRHALRDNDYLKPFLHLPSKENGLDIEGLALAGGRVYLGLRGPVLDSFAVVVRPRLDKRLAVTGHALALLDLGGLAIRDLCRYRDRLLVLAGPTADAPGPYRLYAWAPGTGQTIQTPVQVFAWPETPEKPEGICPDPSEDGALIVVYDSSLRIQGSVYRADRLTGV